VTDSVQQVNERQATINTGTGPLLSIFQLNTTNSSGQLGTYQSVMGTATKNNRAKVSALLEQPEVAALFPKEMRLGV